MSALGHKRTCFGTIVMSALCHKRTRALQHLTPAVAGNLLCAERFQFGIHGDQLFGRL
jgi:hypothetical protein